MTEPTLDEAIRRRFDQEDVAREYALRKNSPASARNRRELACILAGLDGIAPGARVLDLPTGTGRLIRPLLERGHEVLAADYSLYMLEQARAQVPEGQAGRVTFAQIDVMAIDLADDAVDVTICNRLLHHYPTAELRRRALTELARVTRERLVVSYFSNLAVSALRFHLGNWLRRRTPTDRIPVWPATFAADAEAAGLRIDGRHAVRPGRSPQTYLVLSPR
ncbi:MAG TPA: class I SAM-dependent methyltransferase [Pseudomonadales bacterium]|nr:class I SAM-dependent methyltransferase [Pseudomonadales bacterium]